MATRLGTITDKTIDPTKIRVSKHGMDCDLGIMISADAEDEGSSILRKGLLMGKITASGLWAQYDDTAEDGTQVCQGILADQVDLTEGSSDGIATVDSEGRAIQHGIVEEAKCHGVDDNGKADLPMVIFR